MYGASPTLTAADRPSWMRAIADPAAFEVEQQQLGRVWTLLGWTTDVANDGDWFRATLGGRSVFVQRFGDALVGFENVCVHRFYPLRTKDKGNGPIRCGFHHWQYDRQGRAVGIPKCVEMYGVTPRELNAKLRPIEVATCGTMVFGRFADGAVAGESLEQYLGDGFDILRAMTNLPKTPHCVERTIAANWKLLYHVTLDDYHIVAVHPDTFGKNGYLPDGAVRYYRMGRHSAYFYDGKPDSLDKMVAGIRDGSYRPDDYRIFQFFPNVLILHHNVAGIWYVILTQYVPLAADRSMMRAWYYPAPFPEEGKSWSARLTQRLSAPWIALGLGYFQLKVSGEDHTVCEKIQTVAHQIESVPLLATHEERIAWFEETYAEAMAAAPPPLSPQAATDAGLGAFILPTDRARRAHAGGDVAAEAAQPSGG